MPYIIREDIPMGQYIDSVRDHLMSVMYAPATFRDPKDFLFVKNAMTMFGDVLKETWVSVHGPQIQEIILEGSIKEVE